MWTAWRPHCKETDVTYMAAVARELEPRKLDRTGACLAGARLQLKRVYYNAMIDDLFATTLQTNVWVFEPVTTLTYDSGTATIFWMSLEP